jgi:hypothetical protein
MSKVSITVNKSTIPWVVVGIFLAFILSIAFGGCLTICWLGRRGKIPFFKWTKTRTTSSSNPLGPIGASHANRNIRVAANKNSNTIPDRSKESYPRRGRSRLILESERALDEASRALSRAERGGPVDELDEAEKALYFTKRALDIAEKGAVGIDDYGAVGDEDVVFKRGRSCGRSRSSRQTSKVPRRSVSRTKGRNTTSPTSRRS